MKLEDYGITEEYGFIMPNPLEKLPREFDQWNDLAEKAPELTVNKEFRGKVHNIYQQLVPPQPKLCLRRYPPLTNFFRTKSHRDKPKLQRYLEGCLPLLDYNKLRSHEEKRLAHLQLSAITMCYVWQEGDKGVAKVLPKSVAIPYCAISEDLGVQPIIGHVSLVLANWKLKDKDGPRQLPNITTLYNCMPGEEEAVWFITVTAQIELDFAPATQAILDAMKAAEDVNDMMFISSCTCIHNCLRKMKQSISKMHENLSAQTFYNRMRPFLSGYGGKNSPIPDGLIYEGVSDIPKQMIGGSAAQSSTMQCFDVAFGVEHQEDIQSFLRSMRLHMPTGHRKFIDDIHMKSKIREYVLDSGSNEVVSAYNNCIQAATDFRSYHIQIITKYIIVMARQRTKDNEFESVAEQGTGGSSLTPFLKSLRDATLASRIPST